MGATNSTLHYQLSQFISTDKPAWLQDYNGDMQKIDTGINGALVAAESAQNSADSASSGVSTLNDAVTALSATVAGHTSDITDLSGDVNTIESLIGNGTPTAGDHTLVGAINTNTNAIANISQGATTSTLLAAKANITTGARETITIENISQYRYLMILTRISSTSDTFGVTFIPTAIFRNLATTVCTEHGDYAGGFKYLSETSVEAYSYGPNANYMTVQLYGCN